MSDHFSCGKGSHKGGSENKKNATPSKYCQDLSRPPWTKPEEDIAKSIQYEQNQQRVNEMKAYQDNEFGKQYASKMNASQANDECSTAPNSCSCPEDPCASQQKSKPKYKKRPIKPFNTTDQLRHKIFGYIDNQPNLEPLRPFRGYRDDIVRQQLCCSDELVVNPPDPCPEDPCEEWAAEKESSACTCSQPPEPACPSKCNSGRSSASRSERKCKPAAKKCKNKAETASNCQSDELADILEYCKQIKGEATAMYQDSNATNQGCNKKPCQNNNVTYQDNNDTFAEVNAFNAPSTAFDVSNQQDQSGEYEPHPQLRCEEEDDEDDQEDYKDHPMFGGPDAVPKRTLNEEMKMYRVHVANIRKRYFGEMMKNIDDLDTITPDIAAAMVYSEELGLKIKSAPQKAYDYLYPDAPSQPMLNIGHVTDAAPKGIDDIVVPLAPPMMLTANEFPGLEDPAMLDHPRILQVMPSMNLVEEPKATDTMPANDICELVTGTTHVNMMSLLYPEYEGMEEEEEGDEEDHRFNIKLMSSIPAHFSQIQIRGTEPPTWFPGYYVALPSKPDVIIERKYGNILEKVWEEVQPEFVGPSAGAVIIGS